jgi:branched-chain amino acid transport system permease protein
MTIFSRLLKVLELLRGDVHISKSIYEGFFYWTLLIFGLISAIVFFSGDQLLLGFLIQALIYSCLAISYDYFSGLTGYYNLGFGAFVAVGAYVFVLVTNLEINPVLGALTAGCTAATFAWVIGYPLFKLSKPYFAISTLALVVLVRVIDINLFIYTGGLLGVRVKISVSGIQEELLIMSLFTLFILVLIYKYLSKSKLGLIVRCVRENEDVASCIGINVTTIKMLTFVLSSFFAGVSGSLLSVYLGFINADNLLGIGPVLLPITADILGGPGTYIGPLVGASILSIVSSVGPILMNFIAPQLLLTPLIISGVLLLFVGLVAPEGIVKLKLFSAAWYSNPDWVLLRLLGFKD